MEKQHIMQILWLKWYPQMQELEKMYQRGLCGNHMVWERGNVPVDGLRREDRINT